MSYVRHESHDTYSNLRTNFERTTNSDNFRTSERDLPNISDIGRTRTVFFSETGTTNHDTAIHELPAPPNRHETEAGRTRQYRAMRRRHITRQLSSTCPKCLEVAYHGAAASISPRFRRSDFRQEKKCASFYYFLVF